jgi:hypothetical protein
LFLTVLPLHRSLLFYRQLLVYSIFNRHFVKSVKFIHIFILDINWNLMLNFLGRFLWRLVSLVLFGVQVPNLPVFLSVFGLDIVLDGNQSSLRLMLNIFHAFFWPSSVRHTFGRIVCSNAHKVAICLGNIGIWLFRNCHNGLLLIRVCSEFLQILQFITIHCFDNIYYKLNFILEVLN